MTPAWPLTLIVASFAFLEGSPCAAAPPVGAAPGGAAATKAELPPDPLSKAVLADIARKELIQSRMECTIGNRLLRAKIPDDAEPHLQRCLALARTHGSDLGMASALDHLGLVQQARNDPAGARKLHEQALALFRQAGDRGGEAAALTHLGTLLRNAGEPENALVLFESALALLAPKDFDGRARCLNYVANAQIRLGLVATGVYSYRRALEYTRLGKDQQLIAETLHNLELFER